MWATLRWYLLLLWCLSWFLTLFVVFGGYTTQTPLRDEILLFSLVSAAAYYLGGVAWLTWRTYEGTSNRVALAWVVFLFLNSWGPVTLLICWAVMDRPAEAAGEVWAPAHLPDDVGKHFQDPPDPRKASPHVQRADGTVKGRP
jgi:hypothetical protein